MEKMSQSLEDYLEAIYRLKNTSGKARVSDISRLIDVKMPSVNKAVSELKKLGLVDQEPYGSVELTDKGRTLARAVMQRHQLLSNFLQMLGVNAETAERDACSMEHILSTETLNKITAFVKEKKEAKAPPPPGTAQ